MNAAETRATWAAGGNKKRGKRAGRHIVNLVEGLEQLAVAPRLERRIDERAQRPAHHDLQGVAQEDGYHATDDLLVEHRCRALLRLMLLGTSVPPYSIIEGLPRGHEDSGKNKLVLAAAPMMRIRRRRCKGLASEQRCQYHSACHLATCTRAPALSCARH